MASTEPSLILVDSDTDSSPESHSDSDESSRASDAPANVLSSLHWSQPTAISRPRTIHVHSSGDRKGKTLRPFNQVAEKKCPRVPRGVPGGVFNSGQGRAILRCVPNGS